MTRLFAAIYLWLCGGAEHTYYTIVHCFNGDVTGMWVFALSGLYVFASYLLIVAYFYSRYRRVKKTRFARAMMFGALVFLFCGMTGYMMTGMVEIFWPVRRLETIMRVATGTINIFFAISLYRISFVERVLSIDAIGVQNGGK